MAGGQGPDRAGVRFAAVHALCLPQVPGTDAALLIPRQQVLPVWCEGQAGDLQDSTELTSSTSLMQCPDANHYQNPIPETRSPHACTIIQGPWALSLPALQKPAAREEFQLWMSVTVRSAQPFSKDCTMPWHVQVTPTLKGAGSPHSRGRQGSCVAGPLGRPRGGWCGRQSRRPAGPRWGASAQR